MGGSLYLGMYNHPPQITTLLLTKLEHFHYNERNIDLEQG
jgi:hypothetical protein